MSSAELTREHVKTLTNLGGLNHQGRDLYEEIKAVSPLYLYLVTNSPSEIIGLYCFFVCVCLFFTIN